MAAVAQCRARAHRRLGDSLNATEDYREALALWAAAGNRRERAQTLKEFGEFDQEDGDTAQALEHYGEALALARVVGDWDMEVQLMVQTARVYRKAGESDIAITLLTHALERSARRSDLFRERGLAYEALDDRAKALADLEQALAIDPRDLEALVGRGNLRRTGDDYDTALTDYSMAHSDRPGVNRYPL